MTPEGVAYFQTNSRQGVWTMGAQNGKDLLIKVDVDGNGTFETLAGLRATRVSFNAETVDVTSLESEGGWRELLAGAGVRSVAISGRACSRMPGRMNGRGRSFSTARRPNFR